MELKVLFSLALGPFLVLCWLSTAWQDLRRREIALLPLLGLSLAGLWGQAPLWWVAVAVTFFWRWEPQGSLALIPLLFGVGLVTEAYAPTMALVGGLTAWALGWWGGADGILLTVLALRYGLPGLMAGTLVTTVFGVLFLIARRRLLALVPAWADLLAARPVYLTGPGSSRNELPAATALSAAGVDTGTASFFLYFLWR